uniref:Uncharacterized protein n=1 Tax=Lutzomyia longipalpis TaxID=7200 RepID=A0A1B0CF83_LUTLO
MSCDGVMIQKIFDHSGSRDDFGQLVSYFQIVRVLKNFINFLLVTMDQWSGRLAIVTGASSVEN